MRDITKLYHNEFGISFVWKYRVKRNRDLIELVFRETGLSLRYSDLKIMYTAVKSEMEKSSLCVDCANNKTCKPLLLKVPNVNVSFAMSYIEMTNMLDLIKGTLFQLDLNELISCKI